MLVENFVIVDSGAIEYNGCYLDLHNNFDFTALTYDVSKRCVVLEWCRNQGEWAGKEKYERLKLLFESVSIFTVRPRNNAKPYSEDESLSYLGYLHPDDLELMDGFLPPEQSCNDYHLVLGFESGLVIKLYSETIRLLVEDRISLAGTH